VLRAKYRADELGTVWNRRVPRFERIGFPLRRNRVSLILCSSHFVFDLRDPVHPKIPASFTEMGGFLHPHSFLRLANGHVPSAFQHSNDDPSKGRVGVSGGVVEINDQGKLIRASTAPTRRFRAQH
jgi:hypothetical protein